MNAEIANDQPPRPWGVVVNIEVIKSMSTSDEKLKV